MTFTLHWTVHDCGTAEKLPRTPSHHGYSLPYTLYDHLVLHPAITPDFTFRVFSRYRMGDGMRHIPNNKSSNPGYSNATTFLVHLVSCQRDFKSMVVGFGYQMSEISTRATHGTKSRELSCKSSISRRKLLPLSSKPILAIRSSSRAKTSLSDPL